MVKTAVVVEISELLEMSRKVQSLTPKKLI